MISEPLKTKTENDSFVEAEEVPGETVEEQDEKESSSQDTNACNQHPKPKNENASKKPSDKEADEAYKKLVKDLQKLKYMECTSIITFRYQLGVHILKYSTFDFSCCS